MILFGHQIKRYRSQMIEKKPVDRSFSSPQENGLTLVDIAPGCQAKVIGFSQRLPPGRKAHLQAYGLLPGYTVRIIQHSPVTVIQIEHMELALERELAHQVLVVQVI